MNFCSDRIILDSGLTGLNNTYIYIYIYIYIYNLRQDLTQGLFCSGDLGKKEVGYESWLVLC